LAIEESLKGPFGVSPSIRGWIGLWSGLAATLILLLCNHDVYHFPWLIIIYPLIPFSFLVMFIPLAPPTVVSALTTARNRVWSYSWTTLTLAFFWVALILGLSFAYINGLEYLREFEWGACTGHTIGRVVSLGYSSTRGGCVEWAIYEYDVGGVTVTSAVRNASRGFSRGQEVYVGYTTFWPRHSNPRGMSGRHAS
jgi:hypothetical protein